MVVDNEDSQSRAPITSPDDTHSNPKVPVWAELINRPQIVFGLLAGSIIILTIIGIYCLTYSVQIDVTKHEERYDQCIDPERDRSCGQFIPGPRLPKCTCILDFEVKSLIKGKVKMYYELESFDQTNSIYANSRDDEQLKGNPGLIPAESCGNYSYIDSKPIFPCGEVADSMFNDTFIHLKRTDVEPKVKVPVLYTNLFSDATPAFKNPSPEVLANFTAPKSWRLNETTGLPFKPWESNTDLKGVENPAFRAWMDTNLKRKPVWRLDDSQDGYQQGLPPGHYSLKIYMFYGVDRYDGPRKIVLEGETSTVGARSPAGAAVALLLALLLFCAAYFYHRRRTLAQKASPSDTETGAERPRGDRGAPLIRRIRNTITEMRRK